MDHHSFDRLARTLALATSRRRVLKALAGGAGGGVLAALGVGGGSRFDSAVLAQSCPSGTTSCNGACVDTNSDLANCGNCGVVCAGANASLVCAGGACVIQACAAGFADCDGNAANGCETALGTVEHCLSCGDQCVDDGNACTTPACAANAGCTTTGVANGTPCGSNGTCVDGACVACVPGAGCGGDSDCCVGEVCCNGACSAPDRFLDDPEHCGACGQRCPDEPCRSAACELGACTSTPLADGTVCGDQLWCQAGQCVEAAGGPAVVTLTLINADTDADIGPLGDGDTIDLKSLPTKNLNVRANTDPPVVGSVRFGFDDDPDFFTENNPPYAFAGNSGSNYHPWTPPLGAHTITATCYAEENAGGQAGQTLTVRFTVVDGNADDAPISLTLINADTESDIGPLVDGDTLDLAELPTKKLNIRADTNPPVVGSVRFAYDDDPNFRTENSAPYTFAGDTRGNYEAWTPEVGAHTITVTHFEERNAGGAASVPLNVRFTVVEGSGDSGLLFRDDFESGDLSRWTSSANVSVQSDEVAAGRNAARATANGSAAFARHSFTDAQDEIYARVRFNLLDQGDNPVFLLRTRTENAAPLLGVLVGSTGKLSIHNSVLGQATPSTPTAVTPAVWHEVQLRVRVAGNASETEVWYDGTRVGALSGTTTLGDKGVEAIQIGDESSNRRFDVVFDDVAAGTEPIPPADDIPEPEPGGTSGSPGADQSVLLAMYTFRGEGGVDYAKVFYLPRQFGDGFTFEDPSWGSQTVDSAGAFEGWDLFPTYNHSVHRVESRADWITLEVNRPSTIGIVWRGGATVPRWLGGWTKGEDVLINGTAFPTYRKGFPAGTITLGGVYDPGASAGTPRNTYWVLLAEADGKRSPAPVVPGGREAPRANQTCPSWMHDQHTAVGPDGRAYPTWHHLIDPIHWCYYRHEHGSNPAHFSADAHPLYGYVAAAHGMDEPHAGFKTMILDDNSGNRWMISMHFGTAGLGRVCTRFHTVGIAVRNKASGELLADLHLMGDFGRAVVNTTQAVITPAACPDQAAQALADGSRGIRQIASRADRAVNYEPWRIDDPRTILGITGTFTVNNPDAIVICNDSTCNQAVQTGQSGSKRFFTANDGFGIVAGPNAGTFYTDAHGKQLMSAGQPGAVRQYVKPGVSLSVPPGGGTAGHCYDTEAWGKPLVCNANFAQPTNREGSIQPPN